MTPINSLLTTFSFICLLISVLLLWCNKLFGKYGWALVLFLSLSLAIIAGRIEWSGLIPILGLILLLILYQKHSSSYFKQFVYFIATVLLCVGLSSHFFPGFYNLLVLKNFYVSNEAIPFTLYLNYDKTIMGILILGLYCPLIARLADWKAVIIQTLPWLFTLILIILILACLLNFVRLDPKLSPHLLLWSINNLFFVCMAEEALFRGLIQQSLTRYLDKFSYGSLIAIIVASLLFGLAHFVGGIKYIFLATVAGLGYGLIYHTTKRIEGSIIAHFILNFIHFTFFTYPMLRYPH